MWDLIKEWLSVALIAGAGWVAVTLVMLAMGYGHLRQIRAVLRMRRSLAVVPAGSVFHWDEGGVVATLYDAGTDEDVSMPFARVTWPTLMRWKPGRAKSKARVRRRIAAELAWRTALLLLVTVPLFTACVWLTLTSDLLWGYALLVLVGHQTLTAVSGQIFFYKFWPLSVVTTYFFLHRVDWWHPSLQVAAPLFCAFTLLSMVGVSLVSRWERRERLPA
ncbi:hypothetical protein ACIGBL_00515 [Streptomyces sp. NPDC085614]|uniref:hypothetical protein n=1 Tax=Streptomyces sp. NPDC085614 TaxID=3365733 RepID=UPI0037D08BBA